MKKIFLVLLFPFVLFGSAKNVEMRLYGSLIALIFPKKEVVKVWSDDDEKRDLLARINPRIQTVQDPVEADLLIVRKEKNLQFDKPVIAERYAVLKHYGERAVVGFYWKKGRPHLIFPQKALRHFGIELSDKLQPYIVKLP